MSTIDQIINAVESYGDRERNLGKAMARADDKETLRWDNDADKELTEVRRLLDQHITEGA